MSTAEDIVVQPCDPNFDMAAAQFTAPQREIYLRTASRKAKAPYYVVFFSAYYVCFFREFGLDVDHAALESSRTVSACW